MDAGLLQSHFPLSVTHGSRCCRQRGGLLGDDHDHRLVREQLCDLALHRRVVEHVVELRHHRRVHVRHGKLQG